MFVCVCALSIIDLYQPYCITWIFLFIIFEGTLFAFSLLILKKNSKKEFSNRLIRSHLPTHIAVSRVTIFSDHFNSCLYFNFNIILLELLNRCRNRFNTDIFPNKPMFLLLISMSNIDLKYSSVFLIKRLNCIQGDRVYFWNIYLRLEGSHK